MRRVASLATATFVAASQNSAAHRFRTVASMAGGHQRVGRASRDNVWLDARGRKRIGTVRTGEWWRTVGRGRPAGISPRRGTFLLICARTRTALPHQ